MDEIEAAFYLEYELSTILNRIDKELGVVVDSLLDAQIASLLSFTYNVGTNAFLNSTLLKLLLSGAPTHEVAEQFDRWVHGGGYVLPGLVKRRKAEKELFLDVL
jgi:lysozyme